MKDMIQFYIDKILKALIGGWTTSRMKEVVISETKRIGKKLIRGILFNWAWSNLERMLEETYRDIATLSRELGLPDDDYDPRDLENFMARPVPQE